MPRQNVAYLAFNRGLASRLALARADLKRLGLSAEIYTNWMPRVLGSMMLRPGTGYLGSTRDDSAARNLPFVFSTDDKAGLELTASVLRVWISDALISRPTVTTTLNGGDFPSAASLAANWTDDDEAGAVSSWISAGLVGFTGTGTNAARRTNQVTVAGANIGVEHTLDINVARGPITLMVGSTAGDDDYISETVLGTGIHNLALTPTGDFFIRFQSRLARIVHLGRCILASAGTMQIATPWTSSTALQNVRHAQSGDIVYVACKAQQQYKIERRGTRSWSVVKYEPEDGPFRVANTGPITITPSVLTGNGTLTANIPFFRSTHVGALFALTSTGQTVAKSMTALNDATASIRVTGVGTDRTITVILSGLSGTGNTVILQRSFDNSTWVATGSSWTADVTTAIADGLDNQIVYYRLICTVYAAGTTVATLSIPTGSIRGIGRVTAYTSRLIVDVEVLTDFGATNATDNWEEGKWSSYRGWPSAVGLYEGRLGWSGKDACDLSVSDGYESFDPTIEGDSAPISRTIGSGPVDTINWMLDLQRLVLGGQGAEHSCRSTTFDEPLTLSNFNIKPCSTKGSAAVPAVKLDDTGIYVQRGGRRVYQLTFSSEKYDYASEELSAVIPEIGGPSIVRTAAQTMPDPRVHFIRSDGTAAVLVFDKTEQVTCWVEVETDGLIEDVMVLPGDEGTGEDQVYYVVNRTINGSTKRYLERWATEEQCRGINDAGTVQNLCRLGDSYVTYSGISTTVLTGLSHLEGEQVVVWGDGADVGHDSSDNNLYTVSGGQITLASPVANAVIGLPYTARWQSGKLVQLVSQLGIALKDHKNLQGLGLIMADVHRKGLKFGPDFSNLDDLPSVEDGAPVSANAMRLNYDSEPIPFPGTWSIDSRLCLQAIAPRPCTVLCAVIDVAH